MKTLNTSAAFLALALGAASFSSLAANLTDPDTQPLTESFQTLDKNSDGLLNWSEASKDSLFTKKHFAAADTDHDGSLDPTEYSNYKSAAQQKNVKRVVSDSVITTKAKSEILATKGLKSLEISVKTHQGVVILSGFVDSEEAKAKAEEVVSKVDGVKSINNALVVKSS
jgi:hyperosmotically inducible protein